MKLCADLKAISHQFFGKLLFVFIIKEPAFILFLFYWSDYIGANQYVKISEKLLYIKYTTKKIKKQ